LGRRALKATLYTLLGLTLVVALLAGGAFLWLAAAPMPLTFLQGSIQRAINAQLAGLNVTLSDTALELDPETSMPSVRAHNVVLRDNDGQVLATSPKVGVTLDPSAIMRGSVVVRSIELIGPKINARRNLDGSMELGIGEQAAGADEVTVVTPGDIESDVAPDPAPQASTESMRAESGKLAEILSGDTGTGALAHLDDIKVSQAALTFYDEANDATWRSPRADLVFRRMPYGFISVAKVEISSGGKPWHADLSANYRRDAEVYTVNLAVTDLVPANVSDEIFALAQFARFSMPFSGRVEFEVSKGGMVRKASGELFASAGELNLPDYFAKPIQVDEGAFKVNYNVDEDQLKIEDSSLLVGGSKMNVSGDVTPKRNAEGKLLALDIDVLAKAENVPAAVPDQAPQQIDRIAFKGSAAVENARLQIDDLVVMAGETGVRLRGAITGGDESAGIQIAGRLREVSADLLKELWPPILTPNTRAWINEHVSAGEIEEGTFVVNFPANALARALRERQLQDGAVDVSFTMQNVTTTYFKSLPPLQKARGSAHLKGSTFELTLDDGQATLETGETVKLVKGQFIATPLLQREVPGEFSFDIAGSVEDMMAFAAHPDLNMAPADAGSAAKLGGTAKAHIELGLPLIKNPPRERVQISTKVNISDAKLANAMPGINLTDGEFGVTVDPDKITVTGPAKLNGVPADITWSKPRGPGEPTTEIETVADADMRTKIGLKIEDYISGDIPVQAVIGPPSDEGREITVKADLSKVAMKLAAAGWSRKPAKGTTATFTVREMGKGNRRIDDIKIDGPNLKLRGMVSVKGGQIATIKATEIQLEEDDTFAATLTPGEEALNLQLTGTSIDARPYIRQLISPLPAATPDASPKGTSGQNLIVNAQIDTVYAFRGEQVTGVKATFVSEGGTIKTANVEGMFKSGKPLTIRLTPTAEGRELRVASIDGGAVLRSTDFYGKVAGGQLEFYALIGNGKGAPVKNGRLNIERFEVRDEAALAELDARGRPKKSGPRRGGVFFNRLQLPFTSDNQFVRLCKVSLRGPDMGATASGLIRKADGAMDITGTYIPAYILNNALNDVPLLGDILTGGKREGLLGITYAMGGTVKKPEYQLNPLSFLAPGILRKLFEYEQTACRERPRKTNERPAKTN